LESSASGASGWCILCVRVACASVVNIEMPSSTPKHQKTCLRRKKLKIEHIFV